MTDKYLVITKVTLMQQQIRRWRREKLSEYIAVTIFGISRVLFFKFVSSNAYVISFTYVDILSKNRYYHHAQNLCSPHVTGYLMHDKVWNLLAH